MEEPHETIDLPPEPSVLIESLRGMGYSIQSAIADLVDNSISAEAKRIHIHFERDDSGLHYVYVLDNGHGMVEEELVRAMRLGSSNPLDKRGKTDLGRFGMGLKTASFSQCRCVTVFSKVAGGRPSLKCWDLDFLSSPANQGRWSLLANAGPEAGRLPSPLESMEQGTLVVWEKIDRIDTVSERGYFELLEMVGDHIALTFHRLLEGDPDLAIFLNGRRIKPLNPFLPCQPATNKLPEDIIHTRLGAVHVVGYILPTRDRIEGTKPQRIFDKAGGIGGWASNEGFYIYRNRRLISAGGWLGLGDGSRKWTNEEKYKLARIEVDITNVMDADWRIDIRKSVVFPPSSLREDLKRIAADVRKRSQEIFAHGARLEAEPAEEDLSVWLEKSSDADSTYVLNRNHPEIARLMEATRDEAGLAEKVLRMIEKDLPKIKGNTPKQPTKDY